MPLAAAGIVMIAALVVGTTTVTGWTPRHDLHVLAGPRVLDADVARRRAVDERGRGDHAVLDLHVDLRAVLQEDVPSAFQPGGTAGAMRSRPSKSVASASLIASAVTPTCSS